MFEQSTASNQHDFETYVNGLMPMLKRQYDRSVNKDLSQQNWDGLFQRNVIHVLKQAYDEGLSLLQQMSSDLPKGQRNKEGSELSKQAIHYFDALADELMQYALQKHRSSCALSNFPDEHNPAKDYIATVVQEIEREWEYFVFQVQAVMEH